jgi:sugar phosphate isomerase/epimerase
LTKIPVGIQLYTLRDETSLDFIGTLKKVADIGFQVVEFAGYGDIPAKEMKKVLDDLGLRASSSHVGFPFLELEKLKSQLAFQIEYNKEIGSEYIVTPYAPLDKITSMSELQPFLDAFRYIGEECHHQGMKYAYHNHQFEFNKIGDKYILDYIFEAIGPDLLQAELDLYWVKKAGLDPKSCLKQYKGRCPLVHIKDMTADERGYFAEVGRGIINYPAIFEIAEAIGIKYYLVEQDQCERPPLESVKMSMDYLKSLGVV